MSENKPKIDLAGVTAAINDNFNRRDSGAQEGIGSIPLPFEQPAPFNTQPQAPVQEEAPRQERTITAPFIILEFKASETEANKIDSFTAYAEGVEGSPEAIISHLQMVIDTIKEQTAAANSGE
jgi:hypothetical protein